MNVILIAAVDNNNAIGYKGNLLAFLKSDLRRFKELTIEHTVVMGRKTFESLPKGALPNRRNIIITRDPLFSAPNTESVSSLAEAIALAKEAAETELYVIGGGQIYAEAINVADKLEITRLNFDAPLADTWFPSINPKIWKLDANSELLEENGTSFNFQTYVRIKD